MNLKEQFAQFKQDFDERLDTFLAAKVTEADAINPTAGENLRQFQFLTRSGGKRVRPALVYFGALAGGMEPDEVLYDIGMTLEIFHTFALIHDDIIDQSLTRRGAPTMEATYRRVFKPVFGEDIDALNHFAMSAAILGGDYATTIANQLMSSITLDADTKKRVEELYYTMQFELCAGQIDDCFGIGLANWDELEEGRITRMLEAKSGNYSIQKPMLMGGILAGCTPDQMKALASAGEDIGLVFQLTDDIISVFGDEIQTGKSTSSDIIEGKRNLLFARTYAVCSNEEKALFRSIVGNHTATDEQIDAVKRLMTRYSIVDNLYATCKDVTARAVTTMNTHFDPDNTGTRFITELAQYLLVRTS